MAPTLANIVNASSVDARDDDVDDLDGEEDHDEELYAKSSSDQLLKRATTKGYEHLELHHETAGALPASFRNDADISSPLPESQPQSSAEPLMECRECSQCQRETEEEGGRMDEDAGDWYCHECWNTFYE